MSASVLCVISCVSLKVHPGWITIFYSDQLIITNNICHTEFNKVLITDVLPYVADFFRHPGRFIIPVVQSGLNWTIAGEAVCPAGIPLVQPMALICEFQKSTSPCVGLVAHCYTCCAHLFHMCGYIEAIDDLMCACHGCDHRSVTGVTIICV